MGQLVKSWVAFQEKQEMMVLKCFAFMEEEKAILIYLVKKIGGPFSFLYHVFITTIFDAHGHGSYFKTKKS